MPRLQILELPEGVDDERPPFILVIDETPRDEPAFRAFREDIHLTNSLAQHVGASAVLCFEGTIDIPANEISLSDTADGNVVRIRVEPDLDGFTETVMAEALSAQAKAAEAIDQPLSGKAAITDALGLDRIDDWNEIRRAAAEIRRDRDAKADAILAVLNLHRPVGHEGVRICWACSDYDLLALATRNAPVPYAECTTRKALDTEAIEPEPEPA